MNFEVKTFLVQGEAPIQESGFVTFKNYGLAVDAYGGDRLGVEFSKVILEEFKKFVALQGDDSEGTMPFYYQSNSSESELILINALKIGEAKVYKKFPKTVGASVCAWSVLEERLTLIGLGVFAGWLLRDGRWVQLQKPDSLESYRNQGTISPPDWVASQIPLNSINSYQNSHLRKVEFKIKLGDQIFIGSPEFFKNDFFKQNLEIDFEKRKNNVFFSNTLGFYLSFL